MDLVRQASLKRSMAGAAASLRRVTDLNVSGSERNDKHFPFMINIPFPQMIAKLPVDHRSLLLTPLRDADI